MMRRFFPLDDLWEVTVPASLVQVLSRRTYSPTAGLSDGR